MQVFKAFFKVLKKGHMTSTIIYIVIFISISLVFTYAGGEDVKVFEQTTPDVCVFDEDNTDQSRALVDHIGKNSNIVQLENDEDTIIDALYYQQVTCIITIKKGYAQRLANNETSGYFEIRKMHDGYSEKLTEMMVEKYISTVSAYMASGEELTAAAEKAQEALSQKPKVSIVDFGNDSSNDEFSITMYFRYLSYILLSVLINALSPALLTMNKKDLRYRTDCSGISTVAYTIQMYAGGAVFTFGIWLIFMFMGMFVFGGVYSGAVWLCVLNSFIFTLVAASVAVLVSYLVVEENIIQLITQIVSLGMSFLCGVFVDQSLMSQGVLLAARFFPAYWYVKANNTILGSATYDAAEIAKYMLIELAFAIAFAMIAIVIKKSKNAGASKLRSIVSPLKR